MAWLEDTVYGAEDRIHLAVHADDPPATFWEEPAAPPAPAAPTDEPPPGFTPPYAKVAGRGDGRWLPMQAATDPGRVAMYKTLVHPDPKRPYAVVAVVAMDLRALELEMVAGTQEPESSAVPRAHRPGVVPPADRAALTAVWNGGFKAVHGGFGMRIGADTFLPPRERSCTIGVLPDHAVEIRTYAELAADAPRMLAFRQTPPCLIERGEPNRRLLDEFTKYWGASVSGDTIIRRSALGISRDQRFLFYALGDAVSARSIGAALLAAGAYDAAQLDVNQAYPRFLLVSHDLPGQPPDTATLTDPLVPGLDYRPTDYVTSPEPRDFFYVRRKPARG